MPIHWSGLLLLVFGIAFCGEHDRGPDSRAAGLPRLEHGCEMKDAPVNLNPSWHRPASRAHPRADGVLRHWTGSAAYVRARRPRRALPRTGPKRRRRRTRSGAAAMWQVFWGAGAGVRRRRDHVRERLPGRVPGRRHRVAGRVQRSGTRQGFSRGACACIKERCACQEASVPGCCVCLPGTRKLGALLLAQAAHCCLAHASVWARPHPASSTPPVTHPPLQRSCRAPLREQRAPAGPSAPRSLPAVPGRSVYSVCTRYPATPHFTYHFS